MSESIIDILIVGAGEGGRSLIEIFKDFNVINIVGVVDISQNAPGIKLAREFNIPVSQKWDSFLKNKKLDLIIDVTGSAEVYDQLSSIKPDNVYLMDGTTAKLLWILTDQAQKDKIRILKMAKNWQETFDSITDMISIQDKDFKIVAANKAYIDFFDMPLEKMQEKFCYEIVHNKRNPWPTCPTKEVLKTKKRFTEEFFEDRIGKYLEVSVTPIFDSNKEIKGIVHVIRDITDKKKNIQKISQSEHEYRMIAENVTDLIWTMDMKLNFTFLSPSVERLLGYTVEEALKLRLNNLLPPRSFGLVMKTFAEQIIIDKKEKDPHRSISLELEHIRKDKKTIWTEATMRFLRDEKNRPVGIMGITRDITQRKQVEDDIKKSEKELGSANKEIRKLLRELEEKNKNLEETTQMKSDFVSHVSHELRTPLTAVKESISIVRDGSAGEINAEQRDFLETAESSINRLIRLINNILDLQKIESGKIRFYLGENDINEVVQEVKKTVRLLVEEKGLKFELDLGRNIPKFEFDRDKVMQVLMNLMNNALKFTDKGSITIITRREKDDVRVSVKDTGMGIKKEDIDRLFQKFMQLESMTTKERGGTGLGLAISKAIIEHHGGKIWITSKYGKGTEFNFTLPLNQ